MEAMTRADKSNDSDYLRACNGLLRGILRWSELDTVWEQLRRRNDGAWYVYTIGQPPPRTPASSEELERFLVDVRERLRDEHNEDYCGIVYVDDPEEPGFLKIYDPGNLGMVCGSSAAPPLPGWTLSRCAPDDLQAVTSGTGKRRPWWRRVFDRRTPQAWRAWLW
jgi:hypothetical protein